MDRQLKTKWPKLLNGIARQLNPIHGEIFRKQPISYYWSTYQHEWALDVVFDHAADLRHFYPRWVNHAMTTFSSPDVMRFLGKHVNSNGQLHQGFSGEVVSDFKRRAEGVRIKHRVNGNSVKLYDKAYTPKGSVLRAEATIHNADDFPRLPTQGGRPQRTPRLAATAPGHCRLTPPSPDLPQSCSTVSGRFRHRRRHDYPRPTAPATGTTTAMARPSGACPPSLSR
jgi:hypothetical protein